MIIRAIAENDHPELFRWFQSRKWPLPPVEEIAPDLGFVAEKNGVLIACAWAYLTGRAIGFIEWVGTNPDVSTQEGMTGLTKIIATLKGARTPHPVRAWCFLTKNDALAEKFHSLGFRVEENYKRLLWVDKD